MSTELDTVARDEEAVDDIDLVELFAIARGLNGRTRRRLSSDERRAIIAWLDSEFPGDPEEAVTDEDGRVSTPPPKRWSTSQLALIFQVSRRQIQFDRITLQEEAAKALSPEQALRIVNGYLSVHDLRIAQAEAGLAKCEVGSQGHMMYLRLLSDFEKRKMSLLQEVEVVPKALGNLNVTEEIWEAEVSRDDVVSVNRVNGAVIKAIAGAVAAGDDQPVVDDSINADIPTY